MRAAVRSAAAHAGTALAAAHARAALRFRGSGIRVIREGGVREEVVQGFLDDSPDIVVVGARLIDAVL